MFGDGQSVLPPRPNTAGSRPGTGGTRRRSALDTVGDLSSSLPLMPPARMDAETALRQTASNDSLLRILSETDAQADNQFLVFAESGNLAGVQKMIEAGYNLSRETRGLGGFTALHHACNRGHPGVVWELLRAHPPLIHLRTTSGDSALHLSVYSGNLLIVEQLIDRGAKINVQNNEGETPLFYAARKSMPAIVRLLLQRGADAMLQDRFGETAAEHADDPRTRRAFLSRALADAGVDEQSGCGRVRLGYEELMHVFRFLDVRDVCRSSCVAGKWHRVSEAPELWTRLGVRRWEASLQATLGLGGLTGTATSFLSRPSSRRPSKEIKAGEAVAVAVAATKNGKG